MSSSQRSVKVIPIIEVLRLWIQLERCSLSLGGGLTGFHRNFFLLCFLLLTFAFRLVSVSHTFLDVDVLAYAIEEFGIYPWNIFAKGLGKLGTP